MIALAPAARFTPPTKTSGQDDTQILSFSTSVAKPFVRIKRPISSASLTVAINDTRRSQRSIWSSPPPVNQRCSRCRRGEPDILRGLADAGGGKRHDVLVVRRCAFRFGFCSRGRRRHFGRRGRPATGLF